MFNGQSIYHTRKKFRKRKEPVCWLVRLNILSEKRKEILSFQVRSIARSHELSENWIEGHFYHERKEIIWRTTPWFSWEKNEGMAAFSQIALDFYFKSKKLLFSLFRMFLSVWGNYLDDFTKSKEL